MDRIYSVVCRTNEKIDFITPIIHRTDKNVDVITRILLDSKKIENKKIHEAGIPTIQNILNKGGTNKGDFFKKEPEWIDFEQEFIIERREVKEIINDTEKILLVLGISASGKSIILKYAGFKLSKNKDVYIIELKKYTRDEIKRYFDNIIKLNNENATFIVDDAHLYISDCKNLVNNFKRNGCGELIIGSRENEEITGSPKEASPKKKKKRVHIKARDATEEIIKRFLKAKYDFNDERINTISQNIERYKEDLWFLSWALKAYNPARDYIEEKEIYEKI